MSNYYYFASDKIQVFPCANRSKDEASRFTTEYNLTHLGACRTQIISSTALPQGERLIQCWVKGYYFKFIINSQAISTSGFSTNTDLYLQISISDTNGLPAPVAQQGKLTTFEKDKALEQGGKFYGARLADTTSAQASLLLRKGATWQLPGVQNYLRLRNQLTNKIYKIVVDEHGKLYVEPEQVQ